MAETRMEFWHRRGRELHKMSKAELIALYRKLGGLGGMYPPEKWTKEEVVTSVADIEWRRLPDDAKKAAPEQMNDRPVMWVNGQGLQLQVQSPAGPLYLQELYMVALMARAYGGEVIRFTYDWTDPEDGHTVSGAGRIVFEELPDPRAQKTEEQSTEQPASPADATVVPIGGPFPGFPSEAELADRIFGPGTAESLGMAARYIERPSGPPVRVDGPGCTPATVREFRPCDDCTTPFTCEEGGEDRCP